MHYVIGDVHGCFSELMMLLEKIEAKDREAKILFLGDYIDRGSEVLKTIEWLMENVSPDGRYQALIGNHEKMAIDWYKEYLDWKKSGLDVLYCPRTEHDFSSTMLETEKVSEKHLEEIISFFGTLPYKKELDIKTEWGKHVKYQIAHAWYDQHEESVNKFNHDAIWLRKADGNNDSENVIIHGHTPSYASRFIKGDRKGNAPGSIAYRKNAVNLDGGCGHDNLIKYPCLLGAVCLENLEEIYHRSLEEQYEYACDLYGKKEVEWNPKKYFKKYKEKNKYREELLQRMGKQ